MKRTVRRALTVLALSAGVSFAATAFATAAPDDPPQSGDPRATAVAGNVVTCAAAGLAGVEIQVTSNITENTYIDITAIPSGYTVTGVVVKGGPAYNKYPNLGALPWNDLHSPLVPSGKPAEISHWFVCAKKDTTTTTTKTTTTTTKTATGTSTSTSTTTPPGSSTTGSSSSSVVTTTTSPAVGAVDNTGSSSGLASTGFNGGPYVLAAGLLLAIGAGALILARRRRS